MDHAQKAAEEHTRQIVAEVKLIRDVAYRLHTQQELLAAESCAILSRLLQLEQSLTVLPTPHSPTPPPMAIPLRMQSP